jgi:YVTN family beta-propeller protein
MITSESTHMVHVVTIPEHKVVANVLVGARPREVVFSADGQWAYVSSEIGGQVSKLEVATNKIVRMAKLDVPDAKPKGVVVSRDQKTLYVSTGGGNAVAAVDADTLAAKATIGVGKRVWGMALSRDGTRLYTCNGLDNTVSVINTAANQVVTTITVGKRPWGIVLDD